MQAYTSICGGAGKFTTRDADVINHKTIYLTPHFVALTFFSSSSMYIIYSFTISIKHRASQRPLLPLVGMLPQPQPWHEPQPAVVGSSQP